MNAITGLYCVGSEILGTKATYDYDPTKLIISVRNLGITGYDVEVWLRKNYHIEVELSDLYNILCIISIGDTERETEILITALTELAAEMMDTTQTKEKQAIPVHVPDIPTLALSPRDAFYAETEVIPFKAAVGRIIAEFIMVYPPGIPIFTPGEIITSENIDFIQKNIDSGLPVQGPEDETFQTIRVIKEHKPFI